MCLRWLRILGKFGILGWYRQNYVGINHSVGVRAWNASSRGAFGCLASKVLAVAALLPSRSLSRPLASLFEVVNV